MAWRTAEAGALVVTLAVLAGLVLAPETTLTIAWFGVVPILPASFLVNAGLWRGVCPIATAGTLFSGPSGRALDGGFVRKAAIVGIVLLFLLVPARRFALNQEALLLMGTLVAIVAVAALLGARYRVKAGFCNALCPILPVEKLYGQSPLLYVRNARCVPCSACTQKGCMDLGQQRAFLSNGSDTTGRAWLRTPLGLFAAAFPGFVFGYFRTADVAAENALGVYGVVLGWAAASFVVLAAVVYLLDVPARTAAPVLAAAAVGLYYWFAGPASAEAFSWPVGTGVWLRWAALALVAIWLAVALARARRDPATDGRTAPERVQNA